MRVREVGSPEEPNTLWSADPSKASFIVCHDQQRSLIFYAFCFNCRFNLRCKFFLNCSCASSLA